MMFDEVDAIARTFEGALRVAEGKALYHLARTNDKGFVVEIGSWKGKSTTYLAAGAQENKHGYTCVNAVDHFHGSPEHQKNGPVFTLPDFKANLSKAGLSEEVDIFVMNSVDASQIFDANEVGLLFIDGDHKYESVRSDLDAWWPKVAPNGIIVLHDVGPMGGLPGPKRVLIEELTRQPTRVKDVTFVDGMSIMKKKDKE